MWKFRIQKKKKPKTEIPTSLPKTHLLIQQHLHKCLSEDTQIMEPVPSYLENLPHQNPHTVMDLTHKDDVKYPDMRKWSLASAVLMPSGCTTHRWKTHLLLVPFLPYSEVHWARAVSRPRETPIALPISQWLLINLPGMCHSPLSPPAPSPSKQ